VVTPNLPRRLPQSEAINDELVTVVIPALNEEDHIGTCLDSVLAQSHKKLQVIVVDGDSNDRTAEVVSDYASRDRRVELHHNPERIVPSSLNVAVSAAKARWLVRVDAHSTIPPDYVSTALGHLYSGRWGAVGGRKDGRGQTSVGEAVAAVMNSRFGVGNSKYHYGTELEIVDHVPFGAYPTALVRQLGGWDAGLAVNQDFEFDYRIRRSGHKILFDPELVIDWHCRQSIPDFFRQYFRYGRGKTVVMRLHPDSIRLRHLAAPTLVLGMVGAAVVAFFVPWLAVAMAAPYVIGLGVASVITARKVVGFRARLAIPFAFVAMHFGWGIGFWRGVIGRTGRSSAWDAVG
jgi:glycosyltransferase involved in cell wall biosynthesis